MVMKNYRNLPGGAVGRARQLRRERTEAEDKLWYALRDGLPAHKWRFQVPFHPYCADFACLKAKLIIEVDGGQHDEQRAYDTRRTRFLESKGFTILRFWNNDVLANVDGVLATISALLTQSPSPSHSAAPNGPLPLPKGEGSSFPLPPGEGGRREAPEG